MKVNNFLIILLLKLFEAELKAIVNKVCMFSNANELIKELVKPYRFLLWNFYKIFELLLPIFMKL